MAEQLTSLQGMSAEQIDAARQAGQLDTMLGRDPWRPPTEGQLTKADVDRCSPEQLVEAQRRDQLTDYLRGDPR